MIVVATAMRLERYIEDESVYEVSVYWENQRISIVRIPQEHFITYEVKPEEGMSQVKIESGIIKEEEGGHQIAFRVEELRDFTPSFNTLEGPKDNRVKRELPIKIEIEEKECAASRAKKPKRKKRTTHQKKAKQIALQRHRQGLTSIRIGSELNVPFSTVRTWIRCYRMNGELKNRWSLFNSKQIIKMLDDSFKPGDLVTYKDIQKMAIKLYDNYDFFKASASWITQLVNKLKLRQTYKIHR